MATRSPVSPSSTDLPKDLQKKRKVIVRYKCPSHESRFHDEMATRLSRSGYGLPPPGLARILRKLSEDELHDLLYNVYRTAQKEGIDALYTPFRNESEEEEF